MNAAAQLSGQVLQAFEEEQARQAAQANIKREPMSGRLHHEEPFGGGEPSEMSFETLDAEQDNSITSNAGFQRRGLSRAMSQTANGAGPAAAWACHPSVANRAGSVAFGAEQPDIKPLLGWYGEDAGEESMRQLATMQAKLNQRLGPEYVSSRAGPGGGPKLHYLEGWKAIDLANDVFGFNGWSTNLVRMDTDFIDVSPDGSRCNVGVSAIMRVTLRDGTFHEDVGYGHIENAKGKAAALEKAKKEAVTDALKRSLRTFGRLVGNCMYDKKYLDTVSKMRPDAQKYDVTQLHRRTDSVAPAPLSAIKDEPDSGMEPRMQVSSSDSGSLGRSASAAAPRASTNVNGISGASHNASVGNHSFDSGNLQRASTTVPHGGAGDGRMAASEQDRSRAERQALAAERQAAFRQRQEEQRLLAAQASEPQRQHQSGETEQDQSTTSTSTSTTTKVFRPPPQLKRAPLAPVSVSPPKSIPDSAAGRVYGKEPGARWSRSSVPAGVVPQVRPDTAQMMEGIDDAALDAAAAAAAGQGVSTSGLGLKAQPEPRRAPSAGRFVTPEEANSDQGPQGAVKVKVGGVTSLSAAGASKRTTGAGAAETREPLQTLEMDDGGSVKRQKR